MTDTSEWLVFGLLRASAGLSIAAFLVFAARVLRLQAPRSEQWAWFFVLAQGVILVPVSIPVPTRLSDSPMSPLPARVPGPFVRDAERTYPDLTASNKDEDQAVSVPTAGGRSAGLGVAVADNPTSPSLFSWSNGVFLVWALGVASLLGVALIRYAAFARRLGLARNSTAESQEEWRQVLDAHSVRTLIPLVVSPDTGPALCRLPGGYRLVVPESAWAELAPAERIAILRHELAHYQRGDLWITLLARCLALVHWFNPLAWWAVSRFESQCEFICDQASASDDPAAFAEILMRLGSGRRARIPIVQAVRSGGLYERIERLLTDSPRPACWKCAIPVAVAIIAPARPPCAFRRSQCLSRPIKRQAMQSPRHHLSPCHRMPCHGLEWTFYKHETIRLPESHSHPTANSWPPPWPIP